MRSTYTFVLILCLVTLVSYAQVGIGTTTPNASLDIVASNQATPANTDGVLIPKVDEYPTVNPGLAQDGMLVYLTGAGSVKKGFYYWDNDVTSWMPLYGNTTTDFYKQATTIAAGNITDTIYRMGSVAIGKNTATAMLDIEQASDAGEGVRITTTGTGYGLKYNLYNEVPINSSGGSQYAVYNNFSGAVGSYKTLYGMYTNFNMDNTGNGASVYGTYTRFQNTTGNGRKYGSYVTMNSINGLGYGSYRSISQNSTDSSPVYGVYATVSSTGLGVHYGVHGSAYGDGNRAISGSNTAANGYAGYFSGRGYFSQDLGVGVSNPLHRLDVHEFNPTGYVTQIRNASTNTAAMGLKIKLGNTAPTSTNYYIGFFDGADGVNGRIQGTGVGVSYQTLSDKRLKTNIQNVSNALGTLNKIQPRVYEYKELKGKKEMGFLAQELQLVYPQAVSGNPDSDVTKNPMMVDYSRLTPLLTAGVNELHEKVNTLEKENKQLKVLLLEMEKRISALEKK